MTTGERELTDAEVDARIFASRRDVQHAGTFPQRVDYDRAIYRAGWQARAGERVPREPTQAMLDAIEYLPQVHAVNEILALHQIRTGALLDVLGGEPTMAVAMWKAMYDAAPIAQPAEPSMRAEKGNQADPQAIRVTREQRAPTQGASAEYLAPSPKTMTDNG